MKISATLQPLIDAVSRPTPSLLGQLRVGQTLPARVLQEIQPGLLRLQLASTVLLARSKVPLDAGTRLLLEVTRPYPLPELKILRPLSRQEVRDQIVRAALPRQLPPAEVRAGLQALRDAPVTQRTPTGDSALSRFAQIVNATGVRLDRLHAGELQRNLASSGLFHEARLAAGGGLPAGDAKFQLLQLLGELRSGQTHGKTGPTGIPRHPDAGQAAQHSAAADGLIARLLRLVEGSLARIQLQQTSALPQDDSQRQSWQLDLPLHVGDDTQDAYLRIEREASKDGQDDDPTWAISLSFDFDTIGVLQCRIALAGERLSTTFWCENATTAADIEQRLPALRQAFEAQGFEVVHLAGRLGEPNEPLITLPIPDRLLDERA